MTSHGIANADKVQDWVAKAHAEGREACGVVIHDVAYELPNAAVRPGHHFMIDSAVLQGFFSEYGPPFLGAWSGVWHSHPSGVRTPSDDDLAWHPRLGLALWVATEEGLFRYNDFGDLQEEVLYGSGSSPALSPGAEAIRS